MKKTCKHGKDSEFCCECRYYRNFKGMHLIQREEKTKDVVEFMEEIRKGRISLI